MHHAVARRAVFQESDQGSPSRHAADEGLGAVDRIERPHIGSVRPVVAELLADDAVPRKRLLDQRPHRRFGPPVGFGHRVECAPARLVLDAECGAEKRPDRIARDGRKLVDKGSEFDSGHGWFPRALIAAS